MLNTILATNAHLNGTWGREKVRGRERKKDRTPPADGFGTSWPTESGEKFLLRERLAHLMAVQRLRTESVMYTGRVSVDSDVKAPSDLLLERLLM